MVHGPLGVLEHPVVIVIFGVKDPVGLVPVKMSQVALDRAEEALDAGVVMFIDIADLPEFSLVGGLDRRSRSVVALELDYYGPVSSKRAGRCVLEVAQIRLVHVQGVVERVDLGLYRVISLVDTIQKM